MEMRATLKRVCNAERKAGPGIYIESANTYTIRAWGGSARFACTKSDSFPGKYTLHDPTILTTNILRPGDIAIDEHGQPLDEQPPVSGPKEGDYCCMPHSRDSGQGG